MKILKLKESECHVHGIPEFLNGIAEKINIDTAQVDYYNITKIEVSENIHDKLLQHYVADGLSKMDVMALFTCYAPRVNSSLEENEVRIAEGFCLLRTA